MIDTWLVHTVHEMEKSNRNDCSKPAWMASRNNLEEETRVRVLQ
jgi:hypothetical protein